MKYLKEVLNVYLSTKNDIELNAIDCNFKRNFDKLQFGDVIIFCNSNLISIFAVYIGKNNIGYRFLKISDFVELGNQNDMLVYLDNEPFIIETWNEFILLEEELNNSKKIFELNENDKNILFDIVYLNAEIPKHKKMKEIPPIDSYPQNIFHREEALDVKEYSIRLLNEIF